MKMITRVNINFKKSANNRFGTRYSLKYGLGVLTSFFAKNL